MKTTPTKTQIRNLSAVLLLAWTGASALAQTPPDGMVLIPGGTFLMGDELGDGGDPGGYPGGVNRELPVHEVYVSDFFMDQHEVTWEKWDLVYRWAIKHGYSFDRGGFSKGEDHPVAASWYDAALWCNARSEMEKKRPAYYTDARLRKPYRRGQLEPYVDWNSGHRLPTEAEWEKAAKGGESGKRFPWPDGDTIDHSRANYFSTWCDGIPCYPYDVNAAEGYHPDFYDGVEPSTNPVGIFAPNEYELFDMAGNRTEWCFDWSGPYDSAPASDPRGPATGTYRIVRGGHLGISAWGCRTTFRSNWSPGCICSGFRCVLPVGQ